MDSLFEMTPSGEVKPAPEVLMITEFNEIWERDKTRSKTKARKELTFVWGMCSRSQKNIWIDFKEPVTRAKIIKEDVFGKDSDWKPDAQIIQAIDKYNARIPKTPMDMMIESVERSISKLTDYLDSVDFTATDNVGKLIHDPKKVRDIISTMGKTVADYNELKRQVAAGKADQDEMIRGGGQKGHFESSDILNDFS